MKARLTAVVGLALAGLAFNASSLFKPLPDVPALGAEIQLLPEQIGPYRKTIHGWRNELGRQAIEEGSLYSVATGIPAQLDFFRNDPSPHNGIGCYLGQGETLLWEHIENLQTINRVATFDIGLAQTREGIRLVAASECRVTGCSEIPLPIWRQFRDFKQFVPQWFSEPTGGVVPVSIMLNVPGAQRDPALESDLRRQMQAFIAALDLEPAIRLAKLQENANTSHP